MKYLIAEQRTTSATIPSKWDFLTRPNNVPVIIARAEEVNWNVVFSGPTRQKPTTVPSSRSLQQKRFLESVT